MADDPNSRSPEPPSILVIDDEEWMRDACRVILAKEGCRVAVAADATAGLEQFAALRPDLVLVDVRMPGINGLEFIRRARALDPDLVAVVITGYASIEVAVDAMKAGAHDFLAKPFEPRELRALVQRGLAQRRLQYASAMLQDGRSGIHGLQVAVLAHQLKSPIASLRQCLEVVLRGYVGELPDKARGMVEVAARRADQAIDLLDDWLALLRLEEGEYLSRTQMVDLQGVLADVATGCGEAPEAAGKTLRRTGAAGPVPIRGDRAALLELFRNLVTNAVRYTQPGACIELRLERQGDDVVVVVADDGPGIPPEEQGRVFQPFYRGKAQRAVAGDGLGLPISLRIARAHGGDLALESTPGVGTTFRCRFPLAGSAEAPGDAAAGGGE